MVRRLLLLTSVLMLLSLNMISAEIMLSQPNAIYNLGDALQVKATLKPSQSSSGFFDLNLECRNESKNFHREHLSLNSGQEKEVKISLLLTRNFLGELKGECVIEANFLQEQEKTQKFKVSDEIDVTLIGGEININAGEEITVKGTAFKKNGKAVEGFVEISMEGMDIKSKGKVAKGSFETKISFPENAASGTYSLIARVSEEYLGEKTSIGEAKNSVNIKSVPKKIEIAISKQNVNPGESLSFKPIIYDQGNEQVVGDMSIKIYDSSSSLIFQGILKSNEDKEIAIETNKAPGYWKIEANALNLKAERLFYIKELEKAKFEIVNDTLIITNIGNVIYRKAVQISIGKIVEVKNIDLNVGDSKKFRLAGPDGKYDISVSDGEEGIEANEVSLIGNVIGVEDVGKRFFSTAKFPLIWLLIIAILGLFALILYGKVAKKRAYAFPSQVPEEGKKQKDREQKKEIKKDLAVPLPTQIERAEQSLVLHGRKENTSIITVRIEELNKVRKSSAYLVENIYKMIAENKGAVYELNNFIIGIFSSPTTKSFTNEMLAVRISKQINEFLKEQNRKRKEKLDYGISLTSGELVLKKEADKLKFTSIGNTMNLARRIATISKEEVLLSENLQKRVMAEVQTEKEVRGGINIYHVKRIVERDRHKEFISDFLARMKESEKKK